MNDKKFTQIEAECATDGEGFAHWLSRSRKSTEYPFFFVRHDSLKTCEKQFKKKVVKIKSDQQLEVTLRDFTDAFEFLMDLFGFIL